MKHSSRHRLHPGQRDHFPSENLFDRIGRAICEARCLPRKELYESWSFVQRVRRYIDAPVVWDLCAGHGLVGFLLALLEPDLVAVRAIDKRKPESHEKLRAALATIDAARVAKVIFEERKLERLEPPAEPVFVVAVHACGRRTDRALDLALASRSSIAVLPCCPEVAAVEIPAAILPRWTKAEAVDLTRIFRLHAAGYRTIGRRVDDGVTACADLIMGLVQTEPTA